MNTNEVRVRNFWSALLFIVCFVIGCMFLYWAVEYYVFNNFDHDRYAISKLQVGNSDSLSVWKLDNRTGELQYCTKSYDKMDHFVCVRSVVIDAKEENTATTAEPLKSVPDTKPQATTSSTPYAAPTPATTPAATPEATPSVKH